MLNYLWHWFNKHLLNCFYLPGAQLGTRAGEVNEIGCPHSLKEATEIYPQGNGELEQHSPHPKYNFSCLVNCWGLMMSFLVNRNQTQLPRALGTFSSWVWPGQIFSLESYFPLSISPFFSCWSHYCAHLSLSFRLNQLSLGKISCFPDVHKLGFAHGPHSLSLSQTC